MIKIKYVFLFLVLVNFEAFAVVSNKPTIVVLKPKVSPEIKGYLHKFINPRELKNELVSVVQSTSKFNILTRKKSNLKDILSEQQFSKSSLSKGGAAEEGKMSATNLIVSSEITSFRFYRKNTPVPNISNKYKQKDSGSVIVNVEIMDSTSGELKKTFILKESFSLKQRMVNKKTAFPHGSNIERMYRKIALKMGDELIEYLFPMLVIDIDDENVYLSRGQGSGLSKGDMLSVYHAGKELFDPYTGESLGVSERKLGVLKIIEVKPKSSVAIPVKKRLIERISIRDVVRK